MERRRLFGYLGAGFTALTGFGAGASAEDRDRAGRGIRGPTPGSLMPTKLFLTTGLGVHDREIQASDRALVRAGIGNYNRDRVSSIVPPGCKVIPREEGLRLLPEEGSVLFTVLPIVVSNVPGQRIASAMGLAVPEDGGTGTVAEVYEEGTELATAEQASRRAVEMALGMLALRMNVDFDPTKAFEPGKAVYQIGGRSVRVHSAAQEATVDPAGKFTSVVASVVYLF